MAKSLLEFDATTLGGRETKATLWISKYIKRERERRRGRYDIQANWYLQTYHNQREVLKAGFFS